MSKREREFCEGDTVTTSLSEEVWRVWRVFENDRGEQCLGLEDPENPSRRINVKAGLAKVIRNATRKVDDFPFEVREQTRYVVVDRRTGTIMTRPFEERVKAENWRDWLNNAEAKE